MFCFWSVRGGGDRGRGSTQERSKRRQLRTFDHCFLSLKEHLALKKCASGTRFEPSRHSDKLDDTALRGQDFEQALTFMVTEKRRSCGLRGGFRGGEERKAMRRFSGLAGEKHKKTRLQNCNSCLQKKKKLLHWVPSFVLYLCHFLWERHKYILVTDWRQDIDSGKNNAPLFRL